LKHKLIEPHSEIRYSALQITDALFQRSHRFRELLLDEFQIFFELVLGTGGNPLPPPKKAAIELKKAAAKSIHNWYTKFSSIYKLLELGYNYLANVKKIDFISFSHQTEAERKHKEELIEKQQIILNKKCDDYINELNGI
jgi:UV-stimulated scaffold protein A